MSSKVFMIICFFNVELSQAQWEIPHSIFTGSSKPTQDLIKGDLVYDPWPGKEKWQEFGSIHAQTGVTAVVAPNGLPYNHARRGMGLTADLKYHFMDPAVYSSLVVDITYFKVKAFSGSTASPSPIVQVSEKDGSTN